MPMGNFSLREAQARPLRVLFTFSCIALGVGAIVAVLLATSTTRRAQRDMLEEISGNADLEIISDGSGFPYAWLKQVQATPGVKVAVPSLNRFASIFVGERKARTQVLGIDPRVDQLVRNYEIVSGRSPTKLDEILLDSSFAESLDISVEQNIKLLGRGGQRDLNVVGLVKPKGSDAVALSSAVYVVLPMAQSLFSTGQTLDQIFLIADDQMDIDGLQTTLQDALGEGATIRQPKTQSEMAKETLYATENGLHLSIGFALLITTFIIYNTFQMAVGERRKQIGILRAIGATRRQVAWMILYEALLVSVLGSIAGSLLGIATAGYLTQVTGTVLQVDLPRTQLSLLPFLVAAVAGIGISLFGALMPAIRASSVQPVEAMRAMEIAHNEEVIARTKIFGVFTLPLGVLILLLSFTGLFPIGTDAVGIMLILVGCVLFIPFVLEAYSLFVVRVLAPFLGFEAHLAQKQLTRHVGRTTLTAGVLFIAISTTTGLAGNILDNVANIRGWYKQGLKGDYFIRASLPDLASGTAADLAPQVGVELQQIPGITSIDPMRFINARSGDDSVLLVVRNFVGSETFFDMADGTNATAIEALRNRETVIGTVLSQRRGLGRGDELPLETPNGTVNLKIAAVANDYLGGGLSVYLNRDYAMELLGIDGVDAYVIKTTPNQRLEVGQRLRAFAKDNGLILQSYSDVVASVEDMTNAVVGSLWVLLAIGAFIAAMGLFNTLTMNILEQTREIGMLRTVAMTRGQVRRLILAQAALLGVLGLLPGMIAGVFVSYAIGLSSLAVNGHSIAFQFRPGLALGCLLAGMCLVVVSALLPAERAARLKLSAALRYE